MRTATLTPAGRQPVRIAQTMAMPSVDLHANAFKSLSKSITKSLTWDNVRLAIAIVAGIVAFLSGILTDDLGTPALVALAVATIAFFVAIAPIFMKKGGQA